MKLTLSEHHLAIKTPHQQQVLQIESGLTRWADERLPRQLAYKLQNHQGSGYVCIKAIDIQLLVKIRHGLMPTDIDGWSQGIVDAILTDMNAPASDNVRHFANEAEFIAAYVIHLLQYQRVTDWPFEPNYQSQLSAKENLVCRLEQKASLLIKAVQYLQQQQYATRLLRELSEPDCLRLLKALGYSGRIDIGLTANLKLNDSLAIIAERLMVSGRFSVTRWLLVLVLTPLRQKQMQKQNRLADEHWQTCCALLVLLRWATTATSGSEQGGTTNDLASLLDQHSNNDLPSQSPRINDPQILYLYQLSQHSSGQRQRFVDLVHWAQHLLQELSGEYSTQPTVSGPNAANAVNAANPRADEKTPSKISQTSAVQLASADDKDKADNINASQTSADLTHDGTNVADNSAVSAEDNSAAQKASSPVQTTDSIPGHPYPLSPPTSTSARSPGQQDWRPLGDQMNGQKGSQSSAQAGSNAVPSVVNLHFAGLSFVLAALLRYVRANELSNADLWLLCCYAVPADVRPLAYSDSGLRLLCLGEVSLKGQWQDASTLCQAVKASHSFTRFCQDEQLEGDEQCADWVLAQFSQFLNGFEQTTAKALFRHFIDWPGDMVIKPNSVSCRVKRLPLAVIVSLSVLFYQQPTVLPGWSDRGWHIGWKD